MQVIFVSRCEKKALKKTRLVLDSFADRIGDNTWRTMITNDGLHAVKNMLRKYATKNTAVSCHWIRSSNMHQLVWIVGQRHKFNPITGVVPVNYTSKNILDTYKENDYHCLPIIKSLTAIAALLHDWGKATKLFQAKLKKNSLLPDPLRHEWISALLFVAFVKQHTENINDDTTWLQQLSVGNINEAEIIKQLVNMQSEDEQYFVLPPLANLVTWLIVSHHRLPSKDIKDTKNNLKNKYTDNKPCTEIKNILTKITATWGYCNSWHENYQQLQQCFAFSYGLLTKSQKWLKELKKWSQRLLEQQAVIIKAIDDGSIRVVLHHARLCLMLGDHNFSSQLADNKKYQTNSGIKLYANTDKKTKQFKQQLDEHLLGVCASSLCISHQLPTLEHELPTAHDIKSLDKSSSKTYAWQDKAAIKIKNWQLADNNNANGCFIVNIASTGCGKTIANAKIMRVFSKDQQSLRYTLALGLRTLTLQTGDEYRDKIGLDNSELAVLIGSQAVTDLHNQTKQEDPKKEQQNKLKDELTAEICGSESSEDIFTETFDEEYKADTDAFYPDVTGISEEKLTTILQTNKQRQLLYAPVVACTIDHLMPATETTRGGKYILPSLRLMSADLVIDEIDDFTGKDLIAISRLIFLAAMLGKKVMISSATIPPEMAKNYYRAYKEGWLLFSKTRDANSSINCAWIDEFNTDVTTIITNENSITNYQTTHTDFINKRIKKLKKQLVKRKGTIINCDDILNLQGNKQQSYFKKIATVACELHQQHYTTDKKTGLKVSFGIVRMANIKPTVDATRFLLADDSYDTTIAIRTMAYHSNQVLLLRNEQEKHLDDILKTARKTDNQAIYQNKIIRQHLNDVHNKQPNKQHLIFILVATPVAEVGRDHDYDWAIIEPSSYRSIIQLAGRVQRHRVTEINHSNIAIMQYNLNAINNKDIAFANPGYESNEHKLKTHNLVELVDEKILANKIDATARISKPMKEDFKPAYNLAHLEHATTVNLLREKDNHGASNINGYIKEAWYLTGLPQIFNPFRQQYAENLEICLIYDANENKSYFVGYDNKKKIVLNSIENLEGIKPATEVLEENLWLTLNFCKSIIDRANVTDEDATDLSQKYGKLTTIKYTNGYYYCDQLGLVSS